MKHLLCLVKRGVIMFKDQYRAKIVLINVNYL